MTESSFDDVWANRSRRRMRAVPGLIWGASRLVWQSSRWIYLASTVLQAVGAIVVLVELLVARDLLRLLLRHPIPGFSHFVVDLVLLAASATVGAFASSAQSELQQLLGELVAQHATNKVIDVANAVDLVTFEQPKFHNRLLRAHLNASIRPYQMATGLYGLVGSALAVGGIAVALLVLQPLFLLLVVVAFMPAWLATTQASRLLYDFGVDQTERDRRRQYLFALMARREEAAELRAFDLGGFFQRRHAELYALRVTEMRLLVRRRLAVNLFGSAASSLLTSATVAVLVLFVTDGRISVAAAGTAGAAVLLLSSRLSSLAASAGVLYESSLFIDDFNGFLAAKPAVLAAQGTGQLPETFDQIRLQDVSFTYPSREAPSVSGIDLTIPCGSVVALVGENGSGKTTLAKLIAGLYRPTAGQVAWDGCDLASIRPDQVRQRCAVVLQDFIRFHLTAGENIRVGRHEQIDDLARSLQAAEAVGADTYLRDLPAGYETLLGTEFEGGSELSLGQWQRLALARTFFRDAPLVILDEPTSSLDARAEYELFQDIRRLFQGRTVVLISHRFGNVRLADHIVVLSKGRIAEQGTHESLMTLGGTYAELFGLQSAGLGLDAPDAAPR